MRPAAGGEPIKLYDKSYALVIGSGAYTQGWPLLSNATKDAEEVAKVLEQQGFEVSLERNLTGERLEQVLKEWFLFAGQVQDARLLVWFAGHGYTVTRREGTPPVAYIVGTDAPNPNAVPPEQKREAERQLSARALPLIRFAEYMKLASARHVLVVFDSCFAGTIFSAVRSAPPPAITRYTAFDARQFITSGTADQTASDDGLFEQLFADAITGKQEGADANRDGYVTANELGNFLQQKLTNLSRNRQTPNYGPLNEPGYDQGDFVFVSREKLAAPTLDANASAVPIDQEADAVWSFVRDLNLRPAFERYLTLYPKSKYVHLATAALRTLSEPATSTTPAMAEAGITTPRGANYSVMRVFFATTRAPIEGGFGSAPGKDLTLGTAKISIPLAHAAGAIEVPGNYVVYTAQTDPEKHFAIMGLNSTSPDDFSAALSASGSDRALVFVHGYNTSFENAIYRATQIAYDLQYKGPVVLFSWPSAATVSSYVQDSERVRASAPQLSKLLKTLASNNKLRAIDLITQATGITAVIAALKETGEDVKLNTLIAVSPDMDAAGLEEQCGLLQKKTKSLTVYASNNDKALGVSETLNGSKRAGQITAQGPLIGSACADVIDTSALVGSMFDLGHSQAIASTAGLQDIRALLQTGIRPPDQRSAVLKPVASQLRPGEIFWRF